MLLAINVVPLEDFAISFDMLIKSRPHNVVVYWEDNYISRMTCNRRANSLFNIGCGTHADALQIDFPEQTIHLKVGHQAFQAIVDCHYPKHLQAY